MAIASDTKNDRRESERSARCSVWQPRKGPRDSRRSTDLPSRRRYSSSPRRHCPKSPIQTGPPVAPLRRLCPGAFLGEPAGSGFIAASSGQRVGQLRDFITWVTEIAGAGSPRAGATRTGRLANGDYYSDEWYSRKIRHNMHARSVSPAARLVSRNRVIVETIMQGRDDKQPIA